MVRTILAFAYVIVTLIFLIPFGLIATFFYLIGFKKLMAKVVGWIEYIWGLSVIKVTGCKVEVTGRENIPKEGGVCFVSNHGGYFDIVLLLAYSCRRVGFVAKRELAFVPFLNMWIYMTGGLFIDRSSISKASRTIAKGVKKIKAGTCLFIFPEGSRSKGQGLLPFHAGSLKLATMAEAPIVPVAITGSYDVWEKTGRVVKTSLKVTYCEPIYTADIPVQDRKLVLSDRIRAVIKEKLTS